MIKINLVILLLCLGQFSIGQESQAKDFYQQMGKAIEVIDHDSIILTITEYGCLGDEINYKVEIKKISDQIRVNFYSERPKDKTNYLSELVTVLDTTFTVEKNILKKNLKAETTKIKSRAVFIEASFKILINEGNSKKEYLFRRGEGLYYILRYNKTWEAYFAKK